MLTLRTMCVCVCARAHACVRVCACASYTYLLNIYVNCVYLVIIIYIITCHWEALRAHFEMRRSISFFLLSLVPAGLPSRGGDVAVYVFDINQSSLPTPCYSILVSFSVFMALSTVFHSLNSPNNSPPSHSVLPVLLLPYWSFQLYISYESFPQPYIMLCDWLGLKHQLTN